MFCYLVGECTSSWRLKSLTISHIRVVFAELTVGVGLSLLQSILGRLKSPTSTTGEDLGVIARELRR